MHSRPLTRKVWHRWRAKEKTRQYASHRKKSLWVYCIRIIDVLCSCNFLLSYFGTKSYIFVSVHVCERLCLFVYVCVYAHLYKCTSIFFIILCLTGQAVGCLDGDTYVPTHPKRRVRHDRHARRQQVPGIGGAAWGQQLQVPLPLPHAHQRPLPTHGRHQPGVHAECRDETPWL